MGTYRDASNLQHASTPRHVIGQLLYPGGVTPKIWLDGDSLTSIGDGNAIATWPDTMGAADATQGTSAQRPIAKINILNGHSVARFTSANSHNFTMGDIQALFPSAATIVVVVAINTDTEYSIYNSAMTSPTDTWWRFATDTNGYLGTFRTARIAGYPASMPSSGNHVFALVSSSSQYEFFLDNVSKNNQTASYSAGNTHSIGGPDNGNASKYYNGDIATILLYATALNNAQLTSIYNDLKTKYGL